MLIARFILAFVLVLMPTVVLGAGSEQTHSSLPQNDSAFITDLQNFLKREDAQRYGDLFYGSVVSGGTHGTVAGLTGTPAAMTAYPGGYYTTETGAVTYSDNHTCWVVAHKDLTGNAGTFTRVAGTHYLLDCASGSKPALPSNSVWLMEVTTAGGAVSVVTDLRTRVPYMGWYATTGELPAAGRRGRLAMVSTSLYIDNGSSWYTYPTWISVQQYGAAGNGSTNDTTAIQNAINACGTIAQGTVGYPNVNGGSSNIVGCVVYFPPGVYRTTATLTARPWVRYTGAGRWSSVLRLDTSVAAAVPVVTASAAGWVSFEDLAIETSGVAIAGQDLLQFNRNGVTFGVKFVLSRINLYRGWRQISISGDSTNSAIRDVYARSAANVALYSDATGSLSTFTIDAVYISGAASHGVQILGGIGNSTINGLITESVGGDGIRFTGAQRNSFNGLYVGDEVAGHGIVLIGCSNNVFSGVNLNQINAGTGSAIYLDGSFANDFNGVRTTSFSRYLVEWVNAFGTSAKTLRVNTIRNVAQSSAMGLGAVNDTQYVDLQNVSPVSLDTATALAPVSALSPYWISQRKADAYSIRHDATPGTTWDIAYPPPDARDRWSFMRDFPGVDSYSLLSRSGGTLGALPATESLGTSLITGDSSTCTTIGAWVATAPDTFTSVAGGVAGNGCRWQAGDALSHSGATLTLATLTANTLYKLTFAAKVVTQGGSLLIWLAPYNNADTTRAASSEYITGTAWRTYTLYFAADGANSIIRIEHGTTVTVGDQVLFDNFLLEPVSSASALPLTGGRRWDATTATGPGSGAGLKLHGADHATNPGLGLLLGGLAFTPITTITNGSTTPSVKGGVVFLTANAAPTTITNFTNGVAGQVIIVLCNDANTTINRDNAYLAGGVNFTCTSADVIALMLRGGFWYELFRSVNS